MKDRCSECGTNEGVIYDENGDPICFDCQTKKLIDRENKEGAENAQINLE